MHPRHTPNVHIAFLVGHIDILVFYRFLHNLFSTIHLHIKHTLKYNKVVIPFKKLYRSQSCTGLKAERRIIIKHGHLWSFPICAKSHEYYLSF